MRAQLPFECEIQHRDELIVRPAVAAENRVLSPKEVPNVSRANWTRGCTRCHQPATFAERADAAFPRTLTDRFDDDVRASFSSKPPNSAVPVLVCHVVDDLIRPELS